MSSSLVVREMDASETELLVNYWVNASPAYLEGMGVDLAKRPDAEQVRNWHESQIILPYEQRNNYYLIWIIDGQASGHTNINEVVYGEHGFMHLHLWQSTNRKKGRGVELVKKSIPFFFENFQLQKLYCQPYAHNPAPNRVLEKVGFSFVKQFVTIPGSLSFEQEVNQWLMEKEDYLRIYNMR